MEDTIMYTIDNFSIQDKKTRIVVAQRENETGTDRKNYTSREIKREIVKDGQTETKWKGREDRYLRDRETDRQTDIQQIYRQTDRQIGRHTHTDREREKDRKGKEKCALRIIYIYKEKRCIYKYKNKKKSEDTGKVKKQAEQGNSLCVYDLLYFRARKRAIGSASPYFLAWYSIYGRVWLGASVDRKQKKKKKKQKNKERKVEKF